MAAKWFNSLALTLWSFVKFCDLFRIYELCLRNDPFRTSANWRRVNKSLKLADILNGRSLIRISAIFLTFWYCSAMIVWMVSCQSGTNVAKFSYFQCLSFVHGALRKNQFVLWIVPEMDTVSWQPFLLLLQSNPLPKIWIIFTPTFIAYKSVPAWSLITWLLIISKDVHQ